MLFFLSSVVCFLEPGPLLLFLLVHIWLHLTTQATSMAALMARFPYRLSSSLCLV
jgi:hypothetical protein